MRQKYITRAWLWMVLGLMLYAITGEIIFSMFGIGWGINMSKASRLNK